VLSLVTQLATASPRHYDAKLKRDREDKQTLRCSEAGTNST